jgi:transaldolase
MGNLALLRDFGCSVYYDGISRSLIASGEAARLIESGICGVTTNPVIFQSAIASGRDYDEAIAAAAASGEDPSAVLWDLILEDVRAAADLLAPVYASTGGADGYVSVEVHPSLAHDEAGTLAAARELWARVDRPNAMIKIPATPEGLACVRPLVASGININVTVLATVAEYDAVAAGYVAGLADRHAAGLPVDVAGVASLFLARIDTVVDGMIDALTAAGASAAGLRGKGGIATAKLAYEHYRQLLADPSFGALAAAGARPVRLLWASTGPKDPAYPNLLYAEALIGRGAVFTLPPQVLAEFEDHGVARDGAITEDVAGAHEVWSRLRALGVADDAVTAGVQGIVLPLFVDAMRQLEDQVAERCAAAGARS